MGMSNFESRAVLRDTLLEEAIHQRLWRRGISSPHHPTQNAYFNAVIERYFSRQGWELAPQRTMDIEKFGKAASPVR